MIVDAQRGYVLTANHVVAQIATARITTRDGPRFTAVKDTPIRSAAQLRNATGLLRIGERVRLAIQRDRGRFDVTVDIAPTETSATPSVNRQSEMR